MTAMHPQPRSGGFLVAAAGAVCTAVGATVLAGWHTGDPSLIRLFGLSGPTAYNTAAGIFAAGLGLMLSGGGPRWGAWLASAATLFFSAASLAEYFTGREVRPTWWLAGLEAARPQAAPLLVELDAAVCLLAIGLVSAAGLPDRGGERLAGVRGIAGVAVAAGALVSLFAALLMPVRLAPFGAVVSMNSAAAAALMLLGAGIIAQSWRRMPGAGSPLARWAPAFIAAGTIAAAGCLWHVMAVEDRLQVSAAVDSEAEHLAYSILLGVEYDALALAAMSEAALPAEPRLGDAWNQRAEGFLAEHPGLVGLAVLDMDCRAIWRHAVAGYERSVSGKALNALSGHCSALGEVGAGDPAVVRAGPEGALQVLVPLTTAGGMRVLVGGVLDFERELAARLQGCPAAREFSFAIFAGDRTIHAVNRDPDYASRLRRRWLRHHGLPFPGMAARIEIWPTSQWLDSSRSPVSDVVLLFGGLLGIVLGATVHLAQRSRRHNRRLQTVLAERRLVEEERNRFFDLSADLLCITNTEGYYIEVNPAWRETLGYSVEELTSRPFLSFVHPDDVQETVAIFADVQAGRLVKGFQNRHLARDGSYRWLLWTSRMSPETKRVYAVAKDITEIRNTQESLQRSAAELRRKNEELTLALASAREATETKNRFIAAISHEIRTPMNGILGMNELLRCTQLDAEQREYANATKESIEALLRIVNDILDFSKIEAGKLEVVNAPFDLHIVLRAVHTLSLPQAFGKGLEFHTEVAGDVPGRVIGDPDRFRQILLNLVSNAIKFTETGSVTVEAEVAERRDAADVLRFRVRDTGIGIPPHGIDAIFEDFTQLDNSSARRFGGSGLGLSISKRLVTMLGGELGCDSEVGKGSTFWFTVPFSRCEQQAVDGLPAPETGAPAPARYSRARRVLVVEDNEINRTVACRLLTREGCLVHAVDRGRGAIAALEKSSYDLVLMDVNMPEMDGFETTGIIRGMEGDGRRTPIVAMTARAMDGDRENCIAAGMDDYLCKPFAVEELRRVVARWTRTPVGAG